MGMVGSPARHQEVAEHPINQSKQKVSSKTPSKHLMNHFTGRINSISTNTASQLLVYNFSNYCLQNLKLLSSPKFDNRPIGPIPTVMGDCY